MPVMYALGWSLQYVVLNRTLGDDILPPLTPAPHHRGGRPRDADHLHLRSP